MTRPILHRQVIWTNAELAAICAKREPIRLTRHVVIDDGEPERWVRVPSFDGYIVSSRGRVRHQRVCAPILKGSLDKDGYRRVCLHGCTLRVHAVVCEAFHGPRPEGLECAHLDGDKTNNASSNLAWVTPAENNSHKALQGRPNGGHREFWRHRLTLSAETIECIRCSPLSTRKAAEEFGVSQSYVSRIRTGTRRAGNVA